MNSAHGPGIRGLCPPRSLCSLFSPHTFIIISLQPGRVFGKLESLLLLHSTTSWLAWIRGPWRLLFGWGGATRSNPTHSLETLLPSPLSGLWPHHLASEASVIILRIAIIPLAPILTFPGNVMLVLLCSIHQWLAGSRYWFFLSPPLDVNSTRSKGFVSFLLSNPPWCRSVWNIVDDH